MKKLLVKIPVIILAVLLFPITLIIVIMIYRAIHTDSILWDKIMEDELKKQTTG